MRTALPLSRSCHPCSFGRLPGLGVRRGWRCGCATSRGQSRPGGGSVRARVTAGPERAPLRLRAAAHVGAPAPSGAAAAELWGRAGRGGSAGLPSPPLALSSAARGRTELRTSRLRSCWRRCGREVERASGRARRRAEVGSARSLFKTEGEG